MMIISFVSQKGGVGKSTLSRAVAQELKKNDFLVKLVDLDIQQGTTVDWHRRRLNRGMEPVGSVECFRTIEEAMEQTKNYDAIVIDGAGRSSLATKKIADISDIVIQPSKASLDDLIPAIRLNHELIKQKIPMDKLFIALSQIGTEFEEETAREYLKQAGCNVLDGATYEKTAYRLALNEGKTITETNYKQLNESAELLIQSIFNYLNK